MGIVADLCERRVARRQHLELAHRSLRVRREEIRSPAGSNRGVHRRHPTLATAPLASLQFPTDRAMEGAGLWKAAMRPRLSTVLGKRRCSRRFPHLPQPLLATRKKAYGRLSLEYQPVLDVPGLCPRCLRLVQGRRCRQADEGAMLATTFTIRSPPPGFPSFLRCIE